MDNDGAGNQCDTDTDGDGQLNAVDDDDDNDGLFDGPDGNTTGPPFNSFDPDRDDDGIIDGLDRSPDSNLNNLCDGQGADADFMTNVSNIFTCAATNSITTSDPASVTTASGDLLMISPTVIFGPGFFVEPAGKLSVISTDPTAEIQNPPP